MTVLNIHAGGAHAFSLRHKGALERRDGVDVRLNALNPCMICGVLSPQRPIQLLLSSPEQPRSFALRIRRLSALFTNGTSSGTRSMTVSLQLRNCDKVTDAISSDALEPFTEDDYEIFQTRVGSLPEVSIFLSGEGIKQAERQPLPGTRPHTFSPSMVSAIEGRTGSSTSYDSQSLYSSNTNSRSGASKATSIHLIATSDSADNDNDNATLGGKSTKSVRTLAERAAATGVPVHKLAFNEFHNQVNEISY